LRHDQLGGVRVRLLAGPDQRQRLLGDGGRQPPRQGVHRRRARQRFLQRLLQVRQGAASVSHVHQALHHAAAQQHRLRRVRLGTARGLQRALRVGLAPGQAQVGVHEARVGSDRRLQVAGGRFRVGSGQGGSARQRHGVCRVRRERAAERRRGGFALAGGFEHDADRGLDVGVVGREFGRLTRGRDRLLEGAGQRQGASVLGVHPGRRRVELRGRGEVDDARSRQPGGGQPRGAEARHRGRVPSGGAHRVDLGRARVGHDQARDGHGGVLEQRRGVGALRFDRGGGATDGDVQDRAHAAAAGSDLAGDDGGGVEQAPHDGQRVLARVGGLVGHQGGVPDRRRVHAGKLVERVLQSRGKAELVRLDAGVDVERQDRDARVHVGRLSRGRRGERHRENGRQDAE
jgi:hypothetical protein